MIYGANGYAGRLAARVAKSRGLKPVLAGRDAAQIEPLAKQLGFESRIFPLAGPIDLGINLRGIAAVLHCAGPFSATAKPMLDGCLRAKAHYLDITGEIAVFEDVHSRGDELRSAGIVAIPGVGFDVVPSDCLAAMLKRELPSATHLKLAFKSRYGKLSPGTTKTMLEGLSEGGRIRKDGRIEKVPPAWKIETIAFTEDGASPAVTIPWGDVSTAFYSTGIPNIEVFLGASPGQIKQLQMPGLIRWMTGLAPVQAFIKAQIARRVTGPSDEERARDEMYLYGEASDAAGNKVALRLRTPEGYSLTAETSVTATMNVLEGGLPAGAYTPSMAFGADFVLGFDGVQLTRVGH